MKFTLIATAILLGLTSAYVTYDGYKVYKIFAESPDHNLFLRNLEVNPKYDFWSKINRLGKPVSVMVAPDEQKTFETNLRDKNLTYSIQISDVEETVKLERSHLLKKSHSGRISFDQYFSHADINAYLADLAQRFPNLVTLENIGESYEKRPMNLVRISTSTSTPKRKIFVDAGIHAREWIAPSAALYLLSQLVENADANSALLENLEWIILPVANPDGYEYSRNTERLWRKTVSPGKVCNGCDANRNFDYYWMYAGASSFECAETYAGKTAFSEKETQNLRDFLLKESGVEGYFTLHSYGNYFLYPWGYDDVLADNWQELEVLGEKAAAAIKSVSGTEYIVGSSSLALYPAAGASDDWAMGVAKVPVVYTIELTGGGANGFDLPPSDIQSVVVETFEGFKVLANHISTR